MKTLRSVLAAMALGATFWAVPGAANATASIDMIAFEGDWNSRATTWHYHITSDDPNNGNSCANSGSTWQSSGYLVPIEMEPPFSGSKHKTRYVTTCKNGDYLTVKLKIDLTSCGAWICTTNWSWQEIRRHGLSYDHEWYGLVNKELDILINPN